MKAAVRTVLRGMLDLVLPGVCIGCGQPTDQAGDLCESCARTLLDHISLPYCPRCGSTVGPNLPIYEDGCVQCPNPLPRFDRTVRLGPYAAPLKQAIRALKYTGRDTAARRLVGHLAQRVRTDLELSDFDVVIPVPVHWADRLTRRTDHAGLLAKRLARQLDLAVSRQLVRTRRVPRQARLSRTARLENVRDAFAVVDTDALAGARVLLVDDVTTTGATAGECARMLKRAGALRVTLAVLAKAEPPAAYAEAWQAT